MTSGFSAYFLTVAALCPAHRQITLGSSPHKDPPARPGPVSQEGKDMPFP